MYLASKSPRRKELLQTLGVNFESINVDIEEIWDGTESAKSYVSRLAMGKARTAVQSATNNWPVLASDTEVVLDSRVLGKPDSIEHGVEILMSLSKQTHEVYSAVVLLQPDETVLVNVSHVTFRELSEKECRDYCELGEPMDKAGAYAIQGMGASFVTRFKGSYSAVMGLPLQETMQLLSATGLTSKK